MSNGNRRRHRLNAVREEKGSSMKFRVWSMFGCGFVAAFIIIAVNIPSFGPRTPNSERRARVLCLSNEKKMGLAFIQYAEDYDLKMPPSTTWMDVTYPYIKVKIHCPKVSHGYGYAYNSILSNTAMSSIPIPSEMPTLYDSTKLGLNETDQVTSAPISGRHQFGNAYGNNYDYTDGHVKWKHTIPPP
jgi:hypothetical protein